MNTVATPVSLNQERTFQEVPYTCANNRCGHVQTIRFFSDARVLPAVCCVECRAGFEMPLEQMLAQHKGMFPGEAKVVQG